MKGNALKRGFSLVELLVAIGIIALLVAMLLPSLQRARELTRSAICKSQLCGLVRANQLYAADNDYHYVPAASDIFWGLGGNLHRWHGARARAGEKFDPAKSPMVRYLGRRGRIRQCPSFTNARSDSGEVAYEAGSGGYGYSDLYVGSQFCQHGFYYNSPGQLSGAAMEDVKHPADTVMFTDAAMPRRFGAASFYVEESFCYCPLGLDQEGDADPGFPREPSIHFRHLGAANVGWSDGHATQRKDFRSIPANCYGADPEEMMVGWFGPDDNSLFDLD